jgi:uncharacterized membrane protein YgdD (TMEM256/DUF423 family)
VSQQSLRFLGLGAVLLAIATGLGAWAAHGLETLVGPQSVETFRTGVEYHFYHALGLLGVALLIDRRPDILTFRCCAWGLTAGIVLFSGSLYALALGGPSILGAIAPLGGLSFIGAWACLAYGALVASRH